MVRAGGKLPLSMSTLFGYTFFMRKSIKVHLKRRGRPATGKEPLVSARLPQAMVDQIGQWAKSNDATRSEAIRCLIELGLGVPRPMKQRSPRAAAKASEMAAEQVERLLNPQLPEQERRARKRRLIKGPKEFREMRAPKLKN